MEMEMEMKGNIPTKFGNMEWEINLNPCGDQVFLGITHESGLNSWMNIDNGGFYFRCNQIAPNYHGKIDDQHELMKEMHDRWRQFLDEQDPEFERNIRIVKNQYRINLLEASVTKSRIDLAKAEKELADLKNKLGLNDEQKSG